MAVKKSVFGSTSERELYTAIDSRWGDRFSVYLSLPFGNIIDILGLELTWEERSYLLKTSVDYTVCTTTDGRPILSIEFDGMSEGFSREGRYVPVRTLADPKRTQHLNLKIRVATQVGYPLIVVSYHEKNPISKETNLRIVDGIIGQVLARKEFHRLIKKFMVEHDSLVAGLDPGSRDEYVQNLVTDAGVAAELEWNPIDREAWNLLMELQEKGVIETWSTEWLNDPELPDVPPIVDPDFVSRFEARVNALKDVVRVGCKMTVHTKFGDVAETAWVRNIDHFGVSPAGLAEDVAMFVVCGRVKEMQDRRA